MKNFENIYALGFAKQEHLLELLNQNFSKEGFPKIQKPPFEKILEDQNWENSLLLFYHHPKYHDAFLTLETLHFNQNATYALPILFICDPETPHLEKLKKSFFQSFFLETPLSLEKLKNLFYLLEKEKQLLFLKWELFALIKEKKWQEAIQKTNQLPHNSQNSQMKIFLVYQALPPQKQLESLEQTLASQPQSPLLQECAFRLTQLGKIEKSLKLYYEFFEQHPHENYGLLNYLKIVQNFGGTIKTLNLLAQKYWQSGLLQQLLPHIEKVFAQLENSNLFSLFYQSILDEKTYDEYSKLLSKKNDL